MDGENRGPVVGLFVEQGAQFKLAQGRGERVEVADDFRCGLGVVGEEPAELDGVTQLLLSRGEARRELLQGIDLAKGLLGRALVVPEVRGGSLLF
jgi:hypothetical protein